MHERLLTPSKITAWLDCAHYLTLKHQVEAGLLAASGGGFSAMAQMIADKGRAHEASCLTEYEARGLSVYRVPERAGTESFAAWTARVAPALSSDYDVLYQLPLVHDGIRGIADFLLRRPESSGWEPVDAKLARAEAKPGHVLQLCFYADALEAATGTPPAQLHLWLGSGATQSLIAAEYRPYWRRLRAQLAGLVDAEADSEQTMPEPCSHCAFCEFSSHCDAQWRVADALQYVAGIRVNDRDYLETAGVVTLAALAERRDPIVELRPARLERLQIQAELQVLARLDPAAPPPYRMLEPAEGRGFALLPEPDDGDVFLDYEGHPFWQPAADLFFLLGLIAREPDGTWSFKTFWAHDKPAEAQAVAELVDYLTERRTMYPSMHVYHYNHTERSALERMARDHGVAELTVAQLVETGFFVDLYEIALGSLQAGVESYGLKHLELLTAYERGHDIDAGAGAVVEYEGWCTSADPQVLARIAAYNEDDVRATRALRDWLLTERPEESVWRPAWLPAEEGYPDLDARIEALHAHASDSAEYLLGDLLRYWVREWRAYVGPRLVLCEAEPSLVLDQPAALGGLTPVGQVERLGKKGQPITPGMRFCFPPQDAEDVAGAQNVLYTTAGGIGFADVLRCDAEAGELDLMWSAKAQELSEYPSTVVVHDWVNPMVKSQAVDDLATQMLDTAGRPNPVSMALLRRELPRFRPGHGPVGGQFGDDVEEMCAWAPHLDHSYVAVQGPPGTGKTFRGARLIQALLRGGKRVGITAVGHHAISNLLEEVVRVLEAAGELHLLNAVQRTPHPGSLAGVTYAAANSAAAKSGVNLVAGTTWLFASKDLAGAPVDVLVIDEAGQLSLADAVAASRSAHNLILLGDPLQLPQVALASHPGGSGASVLQHVLGADNTMPAERGVFITETRRMHPDVCSFISDAIYEGRLTSHPSCALQNTEFGTGLRWLRAEHVDCSTESLEEAALVQAEIQRLLGTKWVDQSGTARTVAPADVLVVAPFNDQVALIRELLGSDPRTTGVQVGTVDKFQGRQAAVVFFTMTTSSAETLSRGADFLFSRNRLNVAISRARCLAYLVCTDDLLNTRARDVETMRLIATLCAFTERAS